MSALGEAPSLPLTRASGMAPLVAFLDSLGAPTSRLLLRAGIAPELQDGGETLVPLDLVHRFVEIASRWADVDNVGVVVGQQTCAYDLGAFGQFLRRTVTVYDYLQTGSRLIGAVSSGERFWLTREGDLVRFHHFQPGQPGSGRCQSDLYAVVVTIGMLRRFLGRQWKPRQVCLMARDAAMVGGDAVFGDTDVRLNQPHSSFTMPLSTLRRAIPASVRYRMAAPGPMAALKPDMPSTFLDNVEALIASLLQTDRPGIEVVAEIAGTSTRTLQRRLQAFGLSYSVLVDATRMGVACDWLAGTGTPIAEIGGMLGYDDPAHFSRAFRRQSGISPRRFRDQHR